MGILACRLLALAALNGIENVDRSWRKTASLSLSFFKRRAVLSRLARTMGWADAKSLMRNQFEEK
jgi:hypothetical protein